MEKGDPGMGKWEVATGVGGVVARILTGRMSLLLSAPRGEMICPIVMDFVVLGTADPRCVRLLHRGPRGALLPRRAAALHRRGHQRDPTDHDHPPAGVTIAVSSSSSSE